VAQALDGAIVEVDLGDDRPAFSSDCGSVAKPWFCAVIETLPGLEILHRLVAAAVAELELEGRAAERVREHLVAEADAEDREVRQQAVTVLCT
jgi:hypothetical protein